MTDIPDNLDIKIRREGEYGTWCWEVKHDMRNPTKRQRVLFRKLTTKDLPANVNRGTAAQLIWDAGADIVVKQVKGRKRNA